MSGARSPARTRPSLPSASKGGRARRCPRQGHRRLPLGGSASGRPTQPAGLTFAHFQLPVALAEERPTQFPRVTCARLRTSSTCLCAPTSNSLSLTWETSPSCLPSICCLPRASARTKPSYVIALYLAGALPRSRDLRNAGADFASPHNGAARPPGVPRPRHRRIT